MNPKSIRHKAAAAALFLGAWLVGNAAAQETGAKPGGTPDRVATEAAVIAPPASAPGPETLDAPPAPALPAAPPVDQAASAVGCCALADGTVVELEIAEPISSKTAQRGQRFKLRLARPLYAGEVMLLAAGTEGFGEVVHADRARAAGKPGELILAGRALDGPDGEIKLRGFRMGGSGENRTVAAFWIPLGFLMRGGQIEIPPGTRAHAKLAGPHRIPPSTATATSTPVDAVDAPAAPLPPPAPASTTPPADDGMASPPRSR